MIKTHEGQKSGWKTKHMTITNPHTVFLKNQSR